MTDRRKIETIKIQIFEIIEELNDDQLTGLHTLLKDKDKLLAQHLLDYLKR